LEKLKTNLGPLQREGSFSNVSNGTGGTPPSQSKYPMKKEGSFSLMKGEGSFSLSDKKSSFVALAEKSEVEKVD
jgi:hypothetical protein